MYLHSKKLFSKCLPLVHYSFAKSSNTDCPTHKLHIKCWQTTEHKDVMAGLQHLVIKAYNDHCSILSATASTILLKSPSLPIIYTQIVKVCCFVLYFKIFIIIKRFVEIHVIPTETYKLVFCQILKL